MSNLDFSKTEKKEKRKRIEGFALQLNKEPSGISDVVQCGSDTVVKRKHSLRNRTLKGPESLNLLSQPRKRFQLMSSI